MEDTEHKKEKFPPLTVICSVVVSFRQRFAKNTPVLIMYCLILECIYLIYTVISNAMYYNFMYCMPSDVL